MGNSVPRFRIFLQFLIFLRKFLKFLFRFVVSSASSDICSFLYRSALPLCAVFLFHFYESQNLFTLKFDFAGSFLSELKTVSSN